MELPILQIVAYGLGIFFTFYVSKIALQWLQKHQNEKNAEELLKVKQDSELLAQKMQKESDLLKKKEEEFLKGQG